MDRRKAEVFSFFKERHGLDDHPGYWSENAGPQGPLARLRQIVLAELTEIKVQQSLARSKGLVEDISFQGFQAELVRENARRTAAVAGKQIIYGPRIYGESAFYYIRFRDLAFQLKRVLSREAASRIDEAEIAKFYYDNREFFAGKPLIEVRANIIKALQIRLAEKTIQERCASAKVEVDEPRFRSIVPRSDPDADVSNQPTVNTGQ